MNSKVIGVILKKRNENSLSFKSYIKRVLDFPLNMRLIRYIFPFSVGLQMSAPRGKFHSIFILNNYLLIEVQNID